MTGLKDILNSNNERYESNDQVKSSSELNFRRTTPSMSLDRPSIPSAAQRCDIPQSKIGKKYLINNKLIPISLRRKSANRTSMDSKSSMANISKLHLKDLEAGMRVKLTMAPSIFSLYYSLIPHTDRKQVFPLTSHQEINDNSKSMRIESLDKKLIDCIVSKSVHLIDNSLVNLAAYSPRVLHTLAKKSDGNNISLSSEPPTFNSLDTAVRSLFGISDYTLVRVTRSTSSGEDGSIILKLETATPGDYSLIDDEDLVKSMIHSIGKPGDTPNNLFIKKVIARPRYKSDMKIFLIPEIHDSALYVDERMLERDLINGIVDIDALTSARSIFCTFKFSHILTLYSRLLSLTKLDEERNEEEEEEVNNEKHATVQ